MYANPLKEFRQKKELTQKELADAINYSLPLYKKIEQRRQTPSYNFILALLHAFPEIDIKEMFFEG